MKIKLLLFFSFILFCNLQTNAFGMTMPDSLKYKWIKGEKYVLHQVKQHETWNSVSRKYNLQISELMNANLGVIDLKIGQILNIPVKSTVSVSNKKVIDSISVNNNAAANSIAIMYSVHTGETLFGISKKFGSSVDDVKKWNNLSDNIVHEGQQLIVSYVPAKADLKLNNKSDDKPVPVSTPEKINAKNKAADNNQKQNNQEKAKEEIKSSVSQTKASENSVAKKDDIPMAIAKTDKTVENKKTPVEEAKPKETPVAVKEEVLKENDKTEKNPQVAPPEIIEAKSNAASNKPDINDNPTRTMIPVGKGGLGKTIMQVTESGVCSWITDAEVNQNKYYGLHRTAPIGTIVKVTNTMNDKYVFVKIVGVLPDTGENEKSIIKISQAAVNKISALDSHFQVELSYGVQQ
jgi:LysM repeat protein